MTEAKETYMAGPLGYTPAALRIAGKRERQSGFAIHTTKDSFIPVAHVFTDGLGRLQAEALTRLISQSPALFAASNRLEEIANTAADELGPAWQGYEELQQRLREMRDVIEAAL